MLHSITGVDSKQHTSIDTLGLTGKERILDLACGFGRHSLSFARRGFSVVGVDLTKCFIDDAIKVAKTAFLEIDFIQADIRDLRYENEFDVVLNLADGAIGYLENEEENRRMLFGSWEIAFGEIAQRPASVELSTSARLYSKSELDTILQSRQMEIIDTFSDFNGKDASDKELQLMVYSKKNK